LDAGRRVGCALDAGRGRDSQIMLLSRLVVSRQKVRQNI
jgi:hypothetical protein